MVCKTTIRALPIGLLAIVTACTPGATPPPPAQAGEPITLPPRWTATPTQHLTSTPVRTPTGVPLPLPSSTTRSTWIACSDAPPSRLHIGDSASVSYEPDLPNRLRTIPDMQDGDVVGRLDPGRTVSILEGPRCNDGMVWWRIETQGFALRGWTSEGDTRDYWLIPQELPPTDQPTDY